ncbi:MAG: helix-turn-helix transcriptional regulator [Acutalibacteraceae bacterium]|nr:helix-turn-helix transcriptional regulator [Acutalibacteraceae bacterium]
MSENVTKVVLSDKEKGIKKISERLEMSEDSVKEIYGTYILSPALVTVGKRMKEMREQKGFSLDKMAKELPCSVEFLELIEDGLIPPTSHITIAFTNYFNVLWNSVFKEVKKFIA